MFETFYLGGHHSGWLATAGVPLFISHSELGRRKKLPRAIARWALDSMGFTQLSTHGKWTIPPEDYAIAAQRYQREIGMLDFASIQDWMCEPFITEKTGLTVEEHQRRSVASWLQLRELAPEVPWLPVLQGWSPGEYLDHVAMYDAADRSWRNGMVGVGSVCRRQATSSGLRVFQALADQGLRLHGFGLKTLGLLGGIDEIVTSSDSMAWSAHARHCPEEMADLSCRLTHKNCANCLPFAKLWRAELLSRLERRRIQAVG